jgi:hypothetical protein
MADETRLTLTDEECEKIRAVAHNEGPITDYRLIRAAFAAGRAEQRKRDAESLAAVLLTDSLLDYKTRNRILRRMGIDPETGEVVAEEVR